MMVMTALLSLLLSGLLALASMHAGSMRGVRYWAWAELCMGLSLGLSFTQLTPESGWVVVVGAGLLVLGLNLQWVGNQAFCKRVPDWRWVWGSTALVVLIDIIFTILHPDINSRVIINSLILAVISLSSARVLLKHDDPPLRHALWMTGGGFGVLGTLLIARAAYVALLPAQNYGLYTQIAINPATFFVASAMQMFLVIGFLLMMHRRIANELHTLAARDSLTGVLNRRQLEEDFAHLRALYLRVGGVLSLMMIDVDRFKSINDKHGHLMGDEVLRRLVAVTEATIRKQDYLARYGGEEFCILLPATTEAEAAAIADRLRQKYAETPMGQESAPWFSTISIGVTDSVRAGFEYETMIAAADRALYQAKQDGRDQVVTSSTL